MNRGNTDHDGNYADGPAGKNAGNEPSKSDLALPTKIYPASSKLGRGELGKDIIEGPGCEGKGGYHR